MYRFTPDPMRTPSPLTVATRGIALVVALGALALGCGDAPSVASGDPEPAARPAPVTSETVLPSTMEDEGGAPVAPEPTEAPVPSPEAPAPAPEAARAPAAPPAGTISAPLPERPPMPAPPPVEAPREIQRPAPTPEASGERGAAAEAFWARFQAAVRAKDRAAIERGLAESIRFGDQSYARASEPVQDMVRAIVEEDAARGAYLAVDRLTHTPEGSTFESEASYVVDGETYEVVVFGTVAEVAPGQWRLVEVGSR